MAPFLRQRYFDANGNPLAGGKLYSYQSGTTTPQATYTDSGGLTPNANPIILDANGEASVWLDPVLSYKFVLKDSSDVTQWTVDSIVGLLTASSVVTASIVDSAVTTAKIADDAVTSAKLADDASVDGNRAVTTNHIRDAAVTRAKLATGAQANLTVQTKTTTFTAATTDDVYMCSGSGGAYVVTLPAASSCSGKAITFIRTDDTPVNRITLGTIDGETKYLDTQYEARKIVSDGTNWYTAEHKARTKPASYGSSASFTGFGTMASQTLRWWREGPVINIEVRGVVGTSTATEARVALPTGFTSSSDYLTLEPVGIWFRSSSNANKGGPVFIEPSVGYVTFSVVDIFGSGAAGALSKANGSSMITAGETFVFRATVRCSNLSS